MNFTPDIVLVPTIMALAGVINTFIPSIKSGGVKAIVAIGIGLALTVGKGAVTGTDEVPFDLMSGLIQGLVNGMMAAGIWGTSKSIIKKAQANGA